MLKSVLICLLLLVSVSFSQSLVWERDYQLNESMSASFMPTIIDSEGNIVTFIDEGSSPYFNYYFFKYSPNGDLLSFKPYINASYIWPISVLETNYGYKALCAGSVNMDKFASSLPVFLNTTKEGDSISQVYPYNILDENLYNNAALKLSVQNNKNTICDRGFFFNTYIKESIKIDSNKTTDRSHLIIQCYDTLGIVVWRKGIDTLNSGDQYNFHDLKQASDGSFIICASKYYHDKSLTIQILNIDINGNILKNIQFPANDKLFGPRGIVEIDKGKYAILGQIVSDKSYFISIIDDSGKTIKTHNIPVKNHLLSLLALKKTPKGDLIAFGTNYLTENTGKFYFYSVNKNLEFFWDYEFYEYNFKTNSNGIRDIYFLDNDNFIGTGFKETYKFYLVKFSTKATDVAEDRQIDAGIFPNPLEDGSELNISFHGLGTNKIKIEILNNLGEKVYEKNEINADTENYYSRLKLDLPCGIYWVKASIGNRFIAKPLVVLK